jgi:hypothetical protein
MVFLGFCRCREPWGAILRGDLGLGGRVCWGLSCIAGLPCLVHGLVLEVWSLWKEGLRDQEWSWAPGDNRRRASLPLCGCSSGSQLWLVGGSWVGLLPLQKGSSGSPSGLRRQPLPCPSRGPLALMGVLGSLGQRTVSQDLGLELALGLILQACCGSRVGSDTPLGSGDDYSHLPLHSWLLCWPEDLQKPGPERVRNHPSHRARERQKWDGSLGLQPRVLSPVLVCGRWGN